MKRTNIDEMICKQEGIAEVTREALNKIQLAKLNAVLKREKEREGFYRNLPEKLENLDASQNRRVEQPVPVNVYFTQKETVNIR